jgi:carbon monoxide dehydrogenase subunit G
MELDHEFTVPVPVDRAWSVLLDLERVAPCVPGAILDTVEGDEFTGRLKVKLGAMTITYKGGARILVADESARIVTIEGSAKEARGSGTASATVQAQLHEEGDNTRVTVHTKLNITGRPAQFGRNILAEVGAKLISRFAKALAEELQVPDEERQPPAPESQTPAEEPQPAADLGQVAEEPAPAATAPAEATEPQSDLPKADLPKADIPKPAQTIPDGFSADKSVSEVPEPEVPPQHAAAPAERVPVTPRPVRHSEEAIDLLEVAGPSVAKRAAPLLGGVVALLTVRYLFRRRRGRHHR